MKTEASKVAIALIQSYLGRYGKFESNARSLGRKTC